MLTCNRLGLKSSLCTSDLSIREFGSCTTNSSWHNKSALSSATDALVSLPKPDLIGMNFSRKTLVAQRESEREEEEKWGGKGGKPVAEAFKAGLGMGLH